MTRDDRANDFLNGRAFMCLMGAIMIVATGFAVLSGHIAALGNGHGSLYAIFDGWPGTAKSSLAVNLGLVLFTAGAVLSLNKVFSFIRAYTFVFVSVFFALQLAFPMINSQFYTGTLLCLVAVALAFPLFTCYQVPDRSRQLVFLVFTALSACSMFQYSFLVLALPFLICFAQMKAMSLRGILAMLVGIITPYWIVLGMGIAKPSELTPFWLSEVFNGFDARRPSLLLVAVAVEAVACVALMAINLFTLLNYRLQTRIYNIYFMLLAVAVIVAMCFDFDNFTQYLPLLNLCLAVQVAQAFTLSHWRRRHIIVAVVVALAVVNYALAV